MILRALVRRRVMVTTVKAMMINGRVSKLDAVDPAEEWHDLCFLNKLRKNPGPFKSQTFLKLHVFSIDSFQWISYKEGNVESRIVATHWNRRFSPNREGGAGGWGETLAPSI